MGRAGAGRGGGGRSSSGHGGGRSSSGHRVGGGRAGRGFSGGGYHRNHHDVPSNSGFFAGPFNPNPYGRPRPPRLPNILILNTSNPMPSQPASPANPGFNPQGTPTIPFDRQPISPYPQRRRNGSLPWIILSVIVVLLIIVFAWQGSSSFGSAAIPSSTVNREKVDTGVAFRNDCVEDELGWFDNVASTERRLRSFYDETGIQPYVVFRAYDASLTSDSQKQDYAEQWYDDNIDNEGTLLFMYFAEEDVDDDVGFMALVNGKQISSVMDSEAIDIFWAYIDEYWYSDMSTDDLMVTVFDKTADRIMRRSLTGTDVAVAVVIGAVVIGVAWAAAVLVRQKQQHDRQKALETERILNTPLNDLADPTLAKYESSIRRDGAAVDMQGMGPASPSSDAPQPSRQPTQ